ncbi:hypothetical protein [Brucella pseudogrignonensis]|uniref:hypothetical protein n=1 Tax=Brucella pseudogrignonensis TaxID=419475 RepID=UPI000CFBC478|nr:hypothetical protein [Brucella pseudogrignonensis]MQP40945.1 hypothetical protein [Ochrobactrum sp. MYb237]PQZ40900.1 hypothetical protein CQ059_16750 [Brucella pseudogrignonensis]PRA40381.1 hypothetical protein CQ063_12405 [Brucella pseudogrignonensis]PRA68974.1 hypothetical protein CQ055_12290 [Brucella pseudogrignonensis]
MSTEPLATYTEVLALIISYLDNASECLERENNWLGQYVDAEKEALQDRLTLMELRNACEEEKEAEAEFYDLTLRADQVEKHMRNLAQVAEFAKWASGHLQSFKVQEAVE